MLNYIWAFMLLSGIAYGAWSGNLVEVSNAILDSSAQAVSLVISMAGVVALWCGLMEIAEEAGIVRMLSGLLRPVIGWLFPRLKCKDGEKAMEYITLNFIMNILGTGWSATGPGLMAMEELSGINRASKEPDDGKVTIGEAVHDGKAAYNSETVHDGKAVYNSETVHDSKTVNNSKLIDDSKAVDAKITVKDKRASDEMCAFLVMNISSLQLIPVNIIAYRSAYGAVAPTAIILPALCATGISTLAALIFCKAAMGLSRMRERKHGIR